ncbi:peptide MFS transporter [Pseudoxanthomonas indica]|uniref:Proton-dependent oligopeptide transporter, POT family n=1 Tax=Pseudoxanthomonas indica TaxID=428993 RepID=A0A1T5KGH5_9GAMM|nr:peptide MFS transporter [Pseudoxanthomonas indica]GGD49156.1 MFS transporter [Pseudoxanthomonas indica]SKC62599.1 proton-dependent oligopeptide transporter, POT family [Pseudoxanthomonas indica]
MTESVRIDPTEPTWFGQPRGLTVLFLTQMWEIFSYYGMRTLLVYYMTKHLLLGQQHASLVFGTYVAMAYFTPILGGVVADRWLGKRKAVILGGCIMAAGHGMMAFEAWLYIALGTIALGNGLFTPSLPSQIGDLYKKDDPRSGRAFNIYYVGINLGGLLAPLVCGTLGELYGWHYGFAAAGIGMLLGLVIYVWGGRYLPASEPVVRIDPVKRASLRDYKPTLLLLLAVGLAVTVFRAAYEQLGNTVALWIDSGVDRAAGGMVIPMTWFQSLNPFFVFLLTPFLLAVWRARSRNGREPASMRKMSIGALVIALAYLMLAGLTSLAGAADVHWLWLVLFFGLFTLGELYILPTGLGLFARLAPPGHAATTVAAWFLAIFSGSLAAGATGTLWSSLSHASFFLCLAGLASIAALLLFLLEPLAARIEAQRAGSSATP